MPSDSTIKVYQNCLNKYGHIDYGNPQKVYKELTNSKLSNTYIKLILCAFVWKIRKDDKDSPLLDEYKQIISHIRGRTERDERNHSKVKGIVPDLGSIIKKRTTELENDNSKNHLILSLYTYIAPRRLLDYILLKYIKSVDDIPENYKENNYYIAENGHFIFHKYKTSKTYGSHIIPVPQKLQNIINDYAIHNNIHNGDLLLGMHDVRQLSYILKKLIGCGVDNLRHSYVNNFYGNYNVPSSDVLHKLAIDMGHSVETNLNYRKY